MRKDELENLMNLLIKFKDNVPSIDNEIIKKAFSVIYHFYAGEDVNQNSMKKQNYTLDDLKQKIINSLCSENHIVDDHYIELLKFIKEEKIISEDLNKKISIDFIISEINKKELNDITLNSLKD